MMKGKKLTAQQRDILKRNKIKDAENWVYLKTETVDADGNKSASRFRDKLTYIVVRNKRNDEEKRCLC